MQAMLRRQERADAAAQSAMQTLRDQLFAAERSQRSSMRQVEELEAHQSRMAGALQEIADLPPSNSEQKQAASGSEYLERLVVEVVTLHQQSLRTMHSMQQVQTCSLSALVPLVEYFVLQNSVQLHKSMHWTA